MVQKREPDVEVVADEKKHKLLQGLSIKLLFKDRVYGSLPKDRELLSNWIASKANRPHSQGGRFGDEDTLEEKLKALGLTKGQYESMTLKKDIPYEELDIPVEIVKTPDKEGIVEEEEKASCSFRMIEVGGIPTVPIMRDFQLKAALGQAATTMRVTTKTRGTKTNLREGLQIRPQWIQFTRDGERMDGPDGQEDFIGHVVTPQGRRSVLKRCDYIERATLEFDIYWVRGLIPPKEMMEILVFAGMFNGLGSQRRFEAGKFFVSNFESYTVIELDQMDVAKRDLIEHQTIKPTFNPPEQEDENPLD